MAVRLQTFVYALWFCLVWFYLVVSLAGGPERVAQAVRAPRRRKEGLKGLLKKAKDPVKAATDGIKDVFEDALKPITGQLEKFPDMVDNATRPITKELTKVPGLIDKATDPILSELREIPKTVEKNIKDTEKKITKGVDKLAQDATKQFQFVMKKFNGFLQFFSDIFATIESYLLCGINRLLSFPQCWYYYLLEMMGKLYYLPIAFLVWLFSLQAIEDMVWDNLEAADRFVFDVTSGRKNRDIFAFLKSVVGEEFANFLFPPDFDPNCPADPFDPDAFYGPQTSSSSSSNRGNGEGIHLIHFPESVLDNCYRCKLRKFPKPGSYF